MNIVEPIFAQCRNKPLEPALCLLSTEFNLVSYARLEGSINSICRRIIAAGITPKSRVGIAIENPIFHIMVVIALTRLGIVTISASSRANVLWPITLDGVIADRPLESSPGTTVVAANLGWMTGDTQPIEEKHRHRADCDDICRIFVTAGTEGHRRAIAMTHGMVATRLDRQKLFLGPRAPFCDRTYLDLPLARPLGFQVMFATLWRGGTLVMPWDARKTLAGLAAYKVQNIVAAPQSLFKLAHTVESRPSYSNALAAAFSVRGMGQEMSDWVRARVCPNLTVGYVAPDATMVASMPAQFASAEPGAVGYVLPDVTVEIVDEDERGLPPGQHGNLRIRSEYGVAEYLDNPVATQRDFRHGYFYPGDRGHLTTDNMLVLATETQARTDSDVERIEQILSRHINIAQCGVLAVASESGGQELCALVVPRSYLDAASLRSHCQARLPDGLVPARFLAVADLPRNDDGSIDRDKLPQLLKSQLN